MTNRSAEQLEIIEKTLKEQGLMRDYNINDDIKFSDILELDLSKVESCVSGPKRPQDKVPLSNVKSDFRECLPK
jgi:aconitate hydratase